MTFGIRARWFNVDLTCLITGTIVTMSLSNDIDRLAENIARSDESELLLRILTGLHADIRDLRSDVNNHSKRLLSVESDIKQRKDTASVEDKRRRVTSDLAPVKFSVDAELEAVRAKVTKPSLQRWSWSTERQRYVHLKRTSAYDQYYEDPKCMCEVCINGALWDRDQKACEIIIDLTAE